MNRMFRSRTLILAQMLICLLCWSHGAAMEAENVELGIAGHCRIGSWTPVRIPLDELRTDKVEIQVDDDMGVPTRLVATRSAIVKFGRKSNIVVRNMSADGRVVAVSTKRIDKLVRVIPSTGQAVLVFGDSEPWNVGSSLDRESDEQVVFVGLKDVTELPTQWYGYDGFDLIALPGSAEAVKMYEQVSDQQWGALDQWIKMGGRIVLTVGQLGQQLLTPGKPLTRFLPAESFERAGKLHETSELERFTSASQRLDVLWQTEADLGGGGIWLSHLNQPRGHLECSQRVGRDILPLVIRAPHGLGTVVMSTVDVDSEPFIKWSGQRRFILKLLEYSIASPNELNAETGYGSVSHLGFQDLLGQLRISMDQFDGVVLIPFSLIGLLAAIYILLVGPGEYFLLRRFGAMGSWAWVLFLTTVMAFSGIAIGISRQWKGRQAKWNRVDVVDVDLDSGTVRGSSWAHFFSPKTASYDLVWRPRSEAVAAGSPMGVVYSWQGQAGKSFGGMDADAAAVEMGDGYSILGGAGEDRGVLRGMALTQWSSRSLVASWWQSVQLDTGKLTGNSNGFLDGTAKNVLNVPLKDCILIYDRWFYEVGRLLPGGEINVKSLKSPRSFRSRLTRRRLQDKRDVSTPWDERNLNTARIMEMLMFHETAGGRTYTNLVNRRTAWLEMSSHITAGRAILLGRSSETLSECECRIDRNDVEVRENDTLGFCRIVYPVADDDSHEIVRP